MSLTPAPRPLYTSAQVEQYLNYIQFPKDVRISPEEANTSKGLDFAQELIKYQLTSVPFENLDLHYSTHRSISLDVDHLFHKIVERGNGRGGYCMENNTFFGTILRSLGFQVMPVGARVSSGVNMVDDSKVDQVTHTGFTHTVNIITIAGKKYFADVGFGNRGPTALIPLEDGTEGRSTGDDRGGNLYQLRRQHIRDNTHFNAEQLLWVFAMRFHTNMKFLPVYCFCEIEFLPQDFQMASFFVSKSPTSFFTYSIICSKFIVEDGNVVGDITLFGKDLKERRFGETRSLARIESEHDRVEALKEFLNISLSKPEIAGIRGMMSAIP